MAKPYYLLIFVLAIALAYSQSQTPSSQSTPANNAGSIYGNTTTANPQQTPAQGSPSTQPLPGTTQSAPSGTAPQPATKPGSATDASGGGVAGSAGTGTAATGSPQPAETPAAEANPVISDSDLQSQIQNSLTKEPTLSGESVRVTVSGDNIEMNGNVGSAREKLTASRIVQSYAGNKKVVNHVTVGHAGEANKPQPPQ